MIANQGGQIKKPACLNTLLFGHSMPGMHFESTLSIESFAKIGQNGFTVPLQYRSGPLELYNVLNL
jgi:hypothetical protein